MALFAVTIVFGDTDLRDKIRPEHRVFLKEQFDAGRLVDSGPYVDDTGALLIYEMESEEALKTLIAQDPYSKNAGVIGSIQIKEWNRVFSRT